MTRKVAGILGLGLLCGCAGAPSAATSVPVAEPDCSFRAATSCWTLAARLPPRRAEPADSAAKELAAHPPALFASAADSVSGRD
jgi:hypothetical protein